MDKYQEFGLILIFEPEFRTLPCYWKYLNCDYEFNGSMIKYAFGKDDNNGILDKIIYQYIPLNLIISEMKKRGLL